MRRPLALAAALAVLAPATGFGVAEAAKAPLAGTHRCADGRFVLHVRVKGWNCAKGRREAVYWETTGRGHCRPGQAFRAYTKPPGVDGPGGSYLSCGKGRARVFWVEGGD